MSHCHHLADRSVIQHIKGYLDSGAAILHRNHDDHRSHDLYHHRNPVAVSIITVFLASTGHLQYRALIFDFFSDCHHLVLAWLTACVLALKTNRRPCLLISTPHCPPEQQWVRIWIFWREKSEMIEGHVCDHINAPPLLGGVNMSSITNCHYWLLWKHMMNILDKEQLWRYQIGSNGHCHIWKKLWKIMFPEEEKTRQSTESQKRLDLNILQYCWTYHLDETLIWIFSEDPPNMPMNSFKYFLYEPLNINNIHPRRHLSWHLRKQLRRHLRGHLSRYVSEQIPGWTKMSVIKDGRIASHIWRLF